MAHAVKIQPQRPQCSGLGSIESFETKQVNIVPHNGLGDPDSEVSLKLRRKRLNFNN